MACVDYVSRYTIFLNNRTFFLMSQKCHGLYEEHKITYIPNFDRISLAIQLLSPSLHSSFGKITPFAPFVNHTSLFFCRLSKNYHPHLQMCLKFILPSQSKPWCSQVTCKNCLLRLFLSVLLYSPCS